MFARVSCTHISFAYVHIFFSFKKLHEEDYFKKEDSSFAWPEGLKPYLNEGISLISFVVVVCFCNICDKLFLSRIRRQFGSDTSRQQGIGGTRVGWMCVLAEGISAGAATVGPRLLQHLLPAGLRSHEQSHGSQLRQHHGNRCHYDKKSKTLRGRFAQQRVGSLLYSVRQEVSSRFVLVVISLSTREFNILSLDCCANGSADRLAVKPSYWTANRPFKNWWTE